MKLTIMFLLMLLVVAASSQAAVCELNCAMGHLAAPMTGHVHQTAAMPMHRSHCSESEHAQTGKQLNVCAEGQCKHRAFHFDVQASDDTRITVIDCAIHKAFSSDHVPSVTGIIVAHGTPPLSSYRSPLLFSLRV